MIIEFIYLKHKKQAKQHLSEDDDPVERIENTQCETCIQQNDQTRQHSTIIRPVIQRKINLRMMKLSVSTLLYSQDDEMLHAELSKTWCNILMQYTVRLSFI